MNKTAMIISGGSMNDEFALQCIEKMRPDVIIGVDGGIAFLHRNHIMPAYIIGDFDSAPSEVVSYYEQQTKVSVLRLNPVKDETDTESALRLAMETGAKKVWILGATGTRFDHVWANVQILKIALDSDVEAYILDANNRISLWKNEIVLSVEEQFGTYFSLFPLGGAVEDLTIEGAKYTVAHYKMSPYESRCVSNELIGQDVRIAFPEGIVVLMETKD